MVINLVRNTEELNRQIGETDTESFIFKLFSDSVTPSIDEIKVIRQNIGHAFTVGHSTNGVIGVANGIDGNQITIGTGGLGSSTLHYSASD